MSVRYWAMRLGRLMLEMLLRVSPKPPSALTLPPTFMSKASTVPSFHRPQPMPLSSSSATSLTAPLPANFCLSVVTISGTHEDVVWFIFRALERDEFRKVRATVEIQLCSS